MGFNSILRLVIHTCRVFLLVAVGWLLCGCNRADYGKAHGRRAVIALMDSAEAVMNDAPEHSLELLDSIDSQSIRSRALNARYALLYSEVQYKCYIPAQSDSLIMISVRYYSAGNHHEYLFRSYYCLGCIYYELGQLTNAAVALGQAEQLSELISDGYRLGLLYTQLGSVFRKSCDYPRSEQYYFKAADCYENSGMNIHKAYALYDIAGCEIEKHNFSKGDSLMKIVQDWAYQNDDNRLYADAILSRFSCSLYENNTDISSELYNQYVSAFGEPHNECKILGLFAHYYIVIKDGAKAQKYLNEAWESVPISTSDSINLYYFNSLLAESKGLTNEALKYQNNYISLQNERFRTILHQPVLGAQKEYFQTIAELEALKNKHSRAIFTLSVIIFILIIAIVLIYHHYKRKRVEEQLYDSLTLVEELTASNRTHTDKIAYLKSEIEKQFHERHDVSNLLYSMFIDTKSQDKITKQQLIVIVNSLIKDYTSPEYTKNLDVILNETYNEIMKRLSVPELGLTEKELQLMRFSLAGLTLKSVSVIIKESSQNIYQIKSRLMKKIRSYSEQLWFDLDNLL